MGSWKATTSRQVYIVRQCEHCQGKYSSVHTITATHESTTRRTAGQHVASALSAQEEYLRSQEGLDNYAFLCPICRQFSSSALSRHFPKGLRYGMVECAITRKYVLKFAPWYLISIVGLGVCTLIVDKYTNYTMFIHFWILFALFTGSYVWLVKIWIPAQCLSSSKIFATFLNRLAGLSDTEIYKLAVIAYFETGYDGEGVRGYQYVEPNPWNPRAGLGSAFDILGKNSIRYALFIQGQAVAKQAREEYEDALRRMRDYQAKASVSQQTSSFQYEPSSFKFLCACGQRFEVDEDMQGDKITCPNCKCEITVPNGGQTI